MPGILPVENFGKMVNFAARCRASVPEWMHKAYAPGGDAGGGLHRCRWRSPATSATALIDEGVEHLHVYTLNNPDLTFDVCRTLGYVAAPLAAAVDGYGAA